MGVKDKVFNDLQPTLFKLMDRGLINGAIAVMSVHAEEVGRDILATCGGNTPIEGTVIS